MKNKIITSDLIKLTQKILKNENVCIYKEFRVFLKEYLSSDKKRGSLFADNNSKELLSKLLAKGGPADSTLNDLFKKAEIEYDRDSKLWYYAGDQNKAKKNILKKIAKSKVIFHPSPVMCFFENRLLTDSQYLGSELEEVFPDEIIGSFSNYRSFIIFFKDQESAGKVMLEIERQRASSEKKEHEIN